MLYTRETAGNIYCNGNVNKIYWYIDIDIKQKKYCERLKCWRYFHGNPAECHGSWVLHRSQFTNGLKPWRESARSSGWITQNKFRVTVGNWIQDAGDDHVITGQMLYPLNYSTETLSRVTPVKSVLVNNRYNVHFCSRLAANSQCYANGLPFKNTECSKRASQKKLPLSWVLPKRKGDWDPRHALSQFTSPQGTTATNCLL